MAERLNGSRAQGKLVKEYAERYSVSTATIYRKLQKAEGKVSAVRVTAEERAWAMEVAGYLKLTTNQKGIAPSTETAIRELARMGRLAGVGGQGSGVGGGSELPSRQRMDLVLKALGLRKRDIQSRKPCVRLAAEAPNTWGQADATVASMFYLENSWLGWASEFRKNSPQRTKVLLCSYVDVFSGCLFAKMYEAEGESASVVVKFLYDAWSEKPDVGVPMHGVPWNLYTDQGPAWKAKHVQTLMHSLMVDWKGHMPGNARATGKVERRFLDTARFEALIRGRLAFGHKAQLAEINSWLAEWCIEQNNRPADRIIQSSESRVQSPELRARTGHPQITQITQIGSAGRGTRGRITRNQAWSEHIRDEEIRRVPDWETWINLTAVGEQRRKVSQYMAVNIKGDEYYLSNRPDLVGEYVDVYRGVDRRVYVRHEGHVFGPLEPNVPVNILGIDHRRAPLSMTERNLKEAMASVQDHGMKPIDIAYVRSEEAEVFPQRSGREIEIEGSRGQGIKGSSGRTVRNYLEAKDWIVARVGSLAGLDWEAMAALERTIDGLLEESGEITERELEMIAEGIEGEREEAGAQFKMQNADCRMQNAEIGEERDV